MNSEYDSSDASAGLIDALRDEILELEATADAEQPSIPEHIIGLIADSDVPAQVAIAADDLLVEDDTISGSLHARLVDRVSSGLASRRAAPRYLEQLLRAGREEQGLSVDELAARLTNDADRIESVEAAQVPIDSLDETDIAAWIDELDLELEPALDALRASLLQPAAAYRGEEQRRTRQAVTEFVATVRRLAEERRTQRA